MPNATQTDVVARLEEAAWQKIRQDDLRAKHALQAPDASGQGADRWAPAMQRDGAPCCAFSLNGFSFGTGTHPVKGQGSRVCGHRRTACTALRRWLLSLLRACLQKR